MTLPLSRWMLKVLLVLYLLVFSCGSPLEQRNISKTPLCRDKPSVSQSCVGLGGAGVVGGLLFPCEMQPLFSSEEVPILKSELAYAAQAMSRGESRLEAPARRQRFTFWEGRRNYTRTRGPPRPGVFPGRGAMLVLARAGSGQGWAMPTTSSSSERTGLVRSWPGGLPPHLPMTKWRD